MRDTPVLTLLLLILMTVQAHGDDLARQAVSDDPDRAQAAIAALREQGPAGLEVLMADWRMAASAPAPTDPAALARLEQAIALVARQKDAHFSGLYWYTDLDRAKAAARSANKPILSLRLLGELDTELSCANSRFFRTVLYPNADISKYLRENFILHWSSERPVPKITIDFGDGRKIERTITGNSLHYVMTPDGEVIDAIPGLYGPGKFLDLIRAGHQIAMQYDEAASPESADALLRGWHGLRAQTILQQWQRDRMAITGETPPNVIPTPTRTTPHPDAATAARVAVSKARLESPLLQITMADARNLTQQTDAMWQQIAALHQDESRLDNNSRQLMRTKQRRAETESAVAFAKYQQEDPMLAMIRNFESSVALDTVRNEYLLHRQIHEWFAAGEVQNWQSLNDRIYADLFLTPKSDPWLGLANDDIYTGIKDAGMVINEKR